MTATINPTEIPEHMRMADGADLPEGFTMFSIPDPSGDTRIMWDPRNKDDLATAEAAFDSARKNGMTVYLVNPESGESSGEIVHKFPKKEGKLIAVRQIAGG